MPAGATPGKVSRVNETVTYDQSRDSITALADGGWIVTWTSAEQDADVDEVYYRRYDAAGRVVLGETRVNDYVDSAQTESVSAALDGGGWVVAWTSIGQDGSEQSIVQQAYDGDGNKVGSESVVNVTTAGPQNNVSLVSLSDGGWVVAWLSVGNAGGDGADLYYRRYSSAGIAEVDEHRLNTTLSNQQQQADLIALDDGGWLATWNSEGQDGSGQGIFQQRFAADGTRDGGEVQVNTFSTGHQLEPEVATLADGGWVTVWMSFGKDESAVLASICMQRFDALGNKVGDERDPTTGKTLDQQGAAVAALPDGGWVVAWAAAGGDGDQNGVFMQRFDDAGRKVGKETMVNTVTADNQTSPAITVLADGSWVVTFNSYGQDGDGAGVFQRHYAPDRIGTGHGDGLKGTAWAERLLGKAGDDTLMGLGGRDILIGGDDDDRLTGGGDRDVFVFGAGFGHDRIVDFRAKGGQHDVVDLSGDGEIRSFADLKANHLDEGRAGVIIADGAGNEVLLAGTKISELSAGNFDF